MTNVFEAFAAAASRCPDRPAIDIFTRTGLITYRYADLRADCDRIARILAAGGCRAGDRCAILSDNDARWCASYLGILRFGGIAVPLDTAYKARQVRTVVTDSGARVLLVSARYLATAREALAGLEGGVPLILMAGSEPGLGSLDAADPADVPGMPSHAPAGAADPAVILYTSGTTSDPKGVVLTHGNLLAEKDGALSVVQLNEQDSILGILPLFHALAQVANLLIPLTIGARIVYLETINSTEMMRALHECHITAFCVVPQFYYLLHQRVMEQIKAAPLPVRAAFRSMLALNGWLRARLRLNLGRVLFRRVHDALGGRMRIMVTGGSRFDPGVGRDLYGMGLNIIQAYGLTECSGAATTTLQGDPHVETVGVPFGGCEIRILDDPEDRASREHPDGEVLIRGPVVMAGYYNRPDATAETLRDGWLHTGDLGFIDRTGRLHITGRKKEMIVLSSGKNIYPEEIEAVYLQSPYIKDMCVLGITSGGDLAGERLHGIVVPNLELMRERKIVNTREIIRFDIESLSLQLPHHKRVLSFDVWLEDLPRTTTRKLKRLAIGEMYRTRQTEASAPEAPQEWREEDQVWAADPHRAAALRAIAAALKPGTTVRPDANLELDLGLDSMERVELLAGLEASLGVRVPEDVAHGIFTVRELVEALRPAGDGTPAAPPADADADADAWEGILAQPVDDPEILAILTSRPVIQACMFVLLRTINLAARVLMRLRVSGLDRLPDGPPYLICPNHQSFLDPFLTVGALPYRVFTKLFSVGASEYFATPFTAKMAAWMNVIPVDPDANLVRAMQAGAFGLRNGKILVLFPEGERSADGTPKKFKKGAAILSQQLGVPVVPVAMDGFQTVWPRGRSLQWKRLLPWAGTRSALAFGDPIQPESARADAATDRYTSLTDRLRSSVVAMWEGLGVSR